MKYALRIAAFINSYYLFIKVMHNPSWDKYRDIYQAAYNKYKCPYRSYDNNISKIICEEVKKAFIMFPKKTNCLNRALIAYLLLRKYGFDAKYCIGRRINPIEMHAWVTIENKTVFDSPQQSIYFVPMPFNPFDMKCNSLAKR